MYLLVGFQLEALYRRQPNPSCTKSIEQVSGNSQEEYVWLEGFKKSIMEAISK